MKIMSFLLFFVLLRIEMKLIQEINSETMNVKEIKRNMSNSQNKLIQNIIICYNKTILVVSLKNEEKIPQLVA